MSDSKWSACTSCRQTMSPCTSSSSSKRIFRRNGHDRFQASQYGYAYETRDHRRLFKMNCVQIQGQSQLRYLFGGVFFSKNVVTNDAEANSTWHCRSLVWYRVQRALISRFPWCRKDRFGDESDWARDDTVVSDRVRRDIDAQTMTYICRWRGVDLVVMNLHPFITTIAVDAVQFRRISDQVFRVQFVRRWHETFTCCGHLSHCYMPLGMIFPWWNEASRNGYTRYRCKDDKYFISQASIKKLSLTLLNRKMTREWECQHSCKHCKSVRDHQELLLTTSLVRSYRCEGSRDDNKLFYPNSSARWTWNKSCWHREAEIL